MPVSRSHKKFQYLAGHIALDLLNTVAWRCSNEPQDRLQDVDDLIRWVRGARLSDTQECNRLRQHTDQHPNEAKRLLRQVLELRELCYRFVEQSLAHRPPSAADIDRLNTIARSIWRHGAIEWSNNVLSLLVRNSTSPSDLLLFSLKRSVVEFLISDAFAKVSQCADDRGCGWVFIDESPAKARRWCSMESCGNRAKARRHHMKSKES